MKKATRDFAAWIAGIKGIEKYTDMYERGLMTLNDYILCAMEKEIENKEKEE